MVLLPLQRGARKSKSIHEGRLWEKPVDSKKKYVCHFSSSVLLTGPLLFKRFYNLGLSKKELQGDLRKCLILKLEDTLRSYQMYILLPDTSVADRRIDILWQFF